MHKPGCFLFVSCLHACLFHGLNLFLDIKGGVELKPLTNGHSKTSRSGSIISTLSNGTNVSNGVLKNKVVSMSPENLKQIENAFTTNRDEYASFESSMDACAPKLTPVIVSEEVNSQKKTTLFSPNERDSEFLLLLAFL